MCPLTWTIVVLRTGRRSRPLRADVAQLVAHHLAKVRVAGSNPVVRSKVQVASIPAVEWPSGEATACKAVHTGSIPVSTSNFDLPARLAQRESASLTRKRSLVQSQYRAPALTCTYPSGANDMLTTQLRDQRVCRCVHVFVQRSLYFVFEGAIEPHRGCTAREPSL